MTIDRQKIRRVIQEQYGARAKRAGGQPVVEPDASGGLGRLELVEVEADAASAACCGDDCCAPAGLSDTEKDFVAGVYAQDQVVGLISAFTADQGRTFDESTGAAQRSQETAMQDLRSEWGTSFEAQIGTAKAAFKAAAGSKFEEIAGLQMADGSMLGDSPAIVRIFARLGEQLGIRRQAGPGGAPSPAAMDAQQAKDARTDLMSDEKFLAAYLSSEHPGHGMAVRRMNALAELEVGFE